MPTLRLASGGDELEEGRGPGSPNSNVHLSPTTLDPPAVLGHMCWSSFPWEEMGLSPGSPYLLPAGGGFHFCGFYRPLMHSTAWTPAERWEGGGRGVMEISQAPHCET